MLVGRLEINDDARIAFYINRIGNSIVIETDGSSTSYRADEIMLENNSLVLVYIHIYQIILNLSFDKIGCRQQVKQALLMFAQNNGLAAVAILAVVLFADTLLETDGKNHLTCCGAVFGILSREVGFLVVLVVKCRCINIIDSHHSTSVLVVAGIISRTDVGTLARSDNLLH